MYKKKRKKYLRSSHVDGKREIACFQVETANAKNGGKIVVTWSFFLPFAFHVYVMLSEQNNKMNVECIVLMWCLWVII